MIVVQNTLQREGRGRRKRKEKKRKDDLIHETVLALSSDSSSDRFLIVCCLALKISPTRCKISLH